MLALADAAIQDALRGIVAPGLFLRLYLTGGAEASFAGYGPRWLDADQWIIEGRKATTPRQSWTRVDAGPPQMVAGYFYTRADGTRLGQEAFSDPDAPYAVQNAGDVVQVEPELEQP